MLTFKQWLVRQYGKATIKITQNIVTKFSNTALAKTRSNNSYLFDNYRIFYRFNRLNRKR